MIISSKIKLLTENKNKNNNKIFFHFTNQLYIFIEKYINKTWNQKNKKKTKKKLTKKKRKPKKTNKKMCEMNIKKNNYFFMKQNNIVSWNKIN